MLTQVSYHLVLATESPTPDGTNYSQPFKEYTGFSKKLHAVPGKKEKKRKRYRSFFHSDAIISTATIFSGG
jgi:hypothetical protein